MAVNEDLVGFVGNALGRGTSRGEIQDVLTKAGWDSRQVRAALAAFADVEFPVPVPRPRSQLSARNSFLYLTLFTALYISAFNLGSLLFQLIDTAFPDPAAPTGRPVEDAMRLAIASLIVAVPVFLYFSRLTRREARLDGTEHGSRDRRWLTYLTLFGATAVGVCDLSVLIYNGLGGELTVRFVLKGLTVGGIAGAVFRYYLWDIKAEESGTPS